MKKIALLSVLCLFIITKTYSQPGKNGAYTATANTILNKYSPVVSNIAAGSTNITVVAQAALLGLCPGDLIMIYQAQGATISTINAIGYGAVSLFNNAGLYEYVYVKSVSGNIITTASALVNNYTSSGKTQVIKVPQYTSLTINAAVLINAKSWKDTIVSTVRYRFGGIVAIHASTINNNGTINANASGFRGGQLDVVNQAAYTNSVSNYVSNLNHLGGEKGEGIAGYQPEYDLLGGRYGRGAPANGGGGGNSWNAGGGGGANANNGNAWTGQGVMIANSTNPLAAWQLDPGYVANSNALTTSSGGGRGGYSVGYINNNALVTGPNDPAWGLDDRSEVGGLGGRPLTNINYTNRIYMGGGGGAGDENDGTSNNGGNGGGLVFLIATTSISGNGTISSNGANGGSTFGWGVDAPSGAGAGGSIVLLSPSISLTQNISAKGGNGGDQTSGNAEFEGPGGGGGGGFVALTSSAVIPNVSGGNNGNTNSTSLTEFPANGATAGSNGLSVIATYDFISYDASSILNASVNTPVCSGSNINLTASSIIGATYNWTGPNTFVSTQQNTVIVNAQSSASGIYTVAATVSGCSAITNTVNVFVSDCTGLIENNSLAEIISLYPNPSSGNVTIELKEQLVFDLIIYNAIGQVVFTQNNNVNSISVGLVNKSSGIYHAVISVGNNKVSKRIIIE
jgi:hypothetical protein